MGVLFLLFCVAVLVIWFEFGSANGDSVARWRYTVKPEFRLINELVDFLGVFRIFRAFRTF